MKINLEEIKSRINPAYQDCIGTESYEIKLLCDYINSLLAEKSELLQAIRDFLDDAEECSDDGGWDAMLVSVDCHSNLEDIYNTHIGELK